MSNINLIGKVILNILKTHLSSIEHNKNYSAENKFSHQRTFHVGRDF